MKKIALLLTTLTLFSCKNDSFSIEGKVDGIKDGTKVFLEKAGDLGPVPIDTTTIKNGTFEFEGKIESPDLGFISIDGVIDPQYKSRKTIALIIENGTVNVNFNKDNVQKSIIEGTPNNEKFAQFNKDSEKITQKLTDFENKNREVMMAAQAKKDTATVIKLQNEYMNFFKQMDDLSIEFVKKNPDAVLSALLLENFISRSKMKPEEVKTNFEKLTKEIQDTKSGKRVKKMLDEYIKKSKSSGLAPDFSGKTPDGKTISLKKAMGKVTIIDFWASWCGPCRKENPNVVALYNELHSKGLNIIGVSLDDDAEDWKEAIAKDKLTWTHVSNLQKWKDPIALAYNVEQIPTTFILDSKGTIVAKDLRGDELKAKVKALLGVK